MNLSQQNLADQIGISRRAIIRYENGEREPNLTDGQWKRFCRLIKNRLGLAVLLHFIDNDEPLSSQDTAKLRQILKSELNKLNKHNR